MSRTSCPLWRLRNLTGIGVVGSVAENTGSSFTMNAITPQYAKSVVLGIVSDRDPVSPTPPAGYASRYSFNTTVFGQNFADKAYGSTASTGTAVWGQASTIRRSVS